MREIELIHPDIMIGINKQGCTVYTVLLPGMPSFVWDRIDLTLVTEFKMAIYDPNIEHPCFYIGPIGKYHQQTVHFPKLCWMILRGGETQNPTVSAK